METLHQSTPTIDLCQLQTSCLVPSTQQGHTPQQQYSSTSDRKQEHSPTRHFVSMPCRRANNAAPRRPHLWAWREDSAAGSLDAEPFASAPAASCCCCCRWLATVALIHPFTSKSSLAKSLYSSISPHGSHRCPPQNFQHAQASQRCTVGQVPPASCCRQSREDEMSEPRGLYCAWNTRGEMRGTVQNTNCSPGTPQ